MRIGMKCHDRLSGERFEAADEQQIREHIAAGLNEGETVAYEIETEDEQFFAGEVTG